MRIRTKSTALLLRFFSCNNNAPHKNVTMTLPRRIMETTAMSASACASAVK